MGADQLPGRLRPARRRFRRRPRQPRSHRDLRVDPGSPRRRCGGRLGLGRRPDPGRRRTKTASSRSSAEGDD